MRRVSEESLVRQARKRVNKLKRAKLGRFAVTADELVDVYVYHEASRLKSKWLKAARSAPLIAAQLQDIQDITMKYTNKIALNEDTIRATGEVYYWTGYTIQSRIMDKAALWNNNLLRVAARPELHDYFAVGIWDEEQASEFLASGIDAELARALVGAK